MRALIRKIVLWAFGGSLPYTPPPQPPYDPAALDKIASEGM